jgi:hypothetical protein
MGYMESLVETSLFPSLAELLYSNNDDLYNIKFFVSAKTNNR